MQNINNGKMNIIGLSGHVKGLYRLGFQNVAIGSINGLAKGYSYKKMYGRFNRPKRWLSNKATILKR